ncbi:MAG: hypothetical protein C5S48_00070 [Candidatus Methanogaster sp.]|nr:MAG: hypothetical protein C5S48_00070 [ANME-2 cluster archaeon]
MPHASYPLVDVQPDGTYMARMIDKKRGRVWGVGYGPTRQDAIALARGDQPSEMFIKRSIGWIRRHPIRATLSVGAYMMLRPYVKAIADATCKFVADGMYMLNFPRKVCNVVSRAGEILP